MSRETLYRGYRWLVEQLYDFENYHTRTLDFVMNRGAQVKRDATFRAGDLARFGRILLETLVRGGPRRAWFTLRLLGGTLARRPSAFREAVSFAIVHRAFHEYLEALAEKLDAAIRDLERAAPPAARSAARDSA